MPTARSPFSRMSAIACAILLAAAVLPTQQGLAQVKPVLKGRIQPRPGIPTAPVRPLTTIEWIVPDNLVTIATSSFYTVSRKPLASKNGLPEAASLYVDKLWKPIITDTPIRRDPDKIDLSPIYLHGFRIARIEIEDITEYPQGSGTKVSSPPGSINGHAFTDRRMEFPGSIVTGSNSRTLFVRPIVHYVTMPRGIPDFCRSTYLLHIFVTGPKGTDPLTGKPVPQSPVN